MLWSRVLDTGPSWGAEADTELPFCCRLNPEQLSPETFWRRAKAAPSITPFPLNVSDSHRDQAARAGSSLRPPHKCSSLNSPGKVDVLLGSFSGPFYSQRKHSLLCLCRWDPLAHAARWFPPTHRKDPSLLTLSGSSIRRKF